MTQHEFDQQALDGNTKREQSHSATIKRYCVGVVQRSDHYAIVIRFIRARREYPLLGRRQQTSDQVANVAIPLQRLVLKTNKQMTAPVKLHTV